MFPYGKPTGKAANIFRQSFEQMIKYFLVGVSTVIIDLASLIILKQVFSLNPVLAVALNQLLVIFYNFYLNKYWSFKSFGQTQRQLLRYLSLTAFNYVFSILTMYIFNQLWGFDYRLVRLVAILFIVSWDFFIYKFWIYR